MCAVRREKGKEDKLEAVQRGRKSWPGFSARRSQIGARCLKVEPELDRSALFHNDRLLSNLIQRLIWHISCNGVMIVLVRLMEKPDLKGYKEWPFTAQRVEIPFATRHY